MSQFTIEMKFDPVNGNLGAFPLYADRYRIHHDDDAVWYYNPWTGDRRTANDRCMDPFGFDIVPVE